MRPLAIALLSSLLVLGGGCATTTTLPSDLSEHERSLRLLDEPPLWPEGAAKGYSRRLRLLLFPPRNAYAAIRLDTGASGRAVGHLVRAQRIANSWVIVERRRFAGAPQQLEKLDGLIAQSRLWRRHAREHWPWVEICSGGTAMIIERATPEGYGFSAAHTYCSSPADYLAVAGQVVAMTGDADLATWLQ